MSLKYFNNTINIIFIIIDTSYNKVLICYFFLLKIQLFCFSKPALFVIIKLFLSILFETLFSLKIMLSFNF